MIIDLYVNKIKAYFLLYLCKVRTLLIISYYVLHQPRSKTNRKYLLYDNNKQ